MTANEEYESYLEKSRRFYENSIINQDKKYYDIALFNLQQSMEFLLKALLLKNSGEYPRSHNLKILMNSLSELSNENCKNIINTYISKNGVKLSFLSDAYISSRYFISSYSEDDVVQLVDMVRHFREDIVDVC